MTVEEAINVLDQVAAGVTANRETHATLVKALEVLREAVKPTEPKPE